MIRQPELGKKIADLRKSRNLTQEELVEKCNLSVRTLQRIEGGDVTPRGSTVKLIFEALELDFELYLSASNKGGNKDGKWVEKFYVAIIDLFNLKTNTMKKVSILSITVSVIIIGFIFITKDGKAQDENLKSNSNNQIEDISTNQKLKDGNFSYENCFYENEEMIGYGVKFNKDGVNINVQLIKLNTNTGEFNTGFARGFFLSDKVEATISQDWYNKRLVNCEAKDSLVHNDGKIILYGNAILTSNKDEFIAADKIVLILE